MKRSSISNSFALSANFYIRKQSSKFESTKKSRKQTHQTTNEEELEMFERNQSFMKSRTTKDYRMNENNRDFEASNDDENDDRNLIINASAFAAAELTSSSKFQRLEKFKNSIHRQSRQNNFKKFENDEM